MKSVDIKGNTCIISGKEVNDKDSKFKVCDHVIISKSKNILAKGYTTNWSEEVFVIKEVQNKVPWTYIINGLSDEKNIGTFYQKELQKKYQKQFRMNEIIQKKWIKLYVKWKGYDNSFNGWIDKKDII